VTSHDLSVAVYLLFVLAGLGLQFLSTREGSRVPPIGTLFGRAMRTRSGRVGIVAGWVWVGMHFFAR
jgi:hypothetical protein